MAKQKQYILVSRKKGSKGRWHKAGPYVYPRKSDFGSLASIKRSSPDYNYQIVEK